MRKKLIILAAIVVLIPIVVAVVLNTGDGQKTVKVDDMDISAGIEKSVFDDDGVVIEADDSNESNQKDAAKAAADAADAAKKNSNAADTSSDKKDSKNTSTGKNDSKDKNSSSDKSDKDDSGKADKPVSDKDDKEMDYEKFHAMSPEKQQEYVESFKDIDAFFKWYNKAKKEYDKAHPGIEIDGGAVELE